MKLATLILICWLVASVNGQGSQTEVVPSGKRAEIPIIGAKTEISSNIVLDFILSDITGDGIEEIVFVREGSDIGVCISAINADDFKYVISNYPVYTQKASNNNTGNLPLLIPVSNHAVYKYYTISMEADTVYCHFLNSALEEIHSIIALTGYRDRNVDPPLFQAYGTVILDWNNDHSADLVFGVNRGAELKPRALMGLDIDSGTQILRYDVAPMVNGVEVVDLDRDGHTEILFATGGADAGEQFGPFSRDSSYLALYHNDDEVEILWRYSGVSTYIEFNTFDITGDGYLDIVAFGHSAVTPATQPSQLMWFDGRTREPGGSLVGNHDFRNLHITANGAHCYLYNSDMSGSLSRYRFNKTSNTFLLERNIDVKSPLLFTYADDMNADGEEELFYVNLALSSIEIYNLDLEVLACIPLPNNSNYAKIQRLNFFTPDECHYVILDEDKWLSRIRIPISQLFPSPAWWTAVPIYFWVIPAVLLGLLCYVLMMRRPTVLAGAIEKSDKIAHVLLRDDGRIEEVNHRFLDLFKLPVVGSVQQPITAILDDSAYAPLCEALDRFKKGSRDYTFHELQLNIKGEQKDLAIELFRAHHLDKSGWIELLIMDGSESNQAERIKAWAAMAQRVVHKTKTPLGTIMLALQRLQRSYHRQCKKQADQFDEQLNPALREIARVRDQVNLFVKFSRVHENQMNHKDLNHVLKDLCDEYVETMPRGVELIREWEIEPLPVFIDESQLREAVLNHLDNAITAVRGNGKVLISTHLESHPLKAYGHNGTAILEIRDEGVGIAAANMEKLFSPGFTTSEHGSGMGMVISKSIVEAHEGEIDVHSQQDLGTTIIIRLPLKKVKNNE
ncbi:hypothetical protein KAR48_03650 [bacterium]|nr:hypothetical protein [bacterium]